MVQNINLNPQKKKKDGEFEEDEISKLFLKMKNLEDQVEDTRKSIQIDEEYTTDSIKKLNFAIRSLKEEIIDVKITVNDFGESLSKLVENMESLASKNDFEVLRKYVQMWDPMSFVRREELERILEEDKHQKRKV